MNKKFEYHKEYPEAVYKDRVYRWFTDNISTLSNADLQKFVNDAMYGNLTFQCADEIDIDDPDISMIDHLLMDIASEKNNELIDTYTDEIDWDNDYLENYTMSKDLSMEKLEQRVTKLENKIKEESLKSRVAKLEKMLSKDTWIFNESSEQQSITILVDDKNNPFLVGGKIYVTPITQRDNRVENFNHDMYNEFRAYRYKTAERIGIPYFKSFKLTDLPMFKSLVSSQNFKNFKGDICKLLSTDSKKRFAVVETSDDFRGLSNTILHGAELKRAQANLNNITVYHTEPWVTEYV